MSYLVVIWIVWASMSFMLGTMHLVFWLSNRDRNAYLLSATMGFAAAASGIIEMLMLLSQSSRAYELLLLWENFAIFLILVPLVWFIRDYFGTGRVWLASLITLLWCIGIAVNFLLPGNLTFSHVQELQQVVTFWGEAFSLPVGEVNPWKVLPDIASLLILLYVLDASIVLWREQRRNRAWIVGGAVVVFILVAGIHTPLVDQGVLHSPYIINFAFQAIVMALSYQVVKDAVKANRYARELDDMRRDFDRMSRTTLLGEYASILAHELNQPLTAILSNAQAARKYLEAEDCRREQLEEILDDIVRDDCRASETIAWLRNMLQEEGGGKEWFDLRVALDEILNLLGRDLRRMGIRLSETYDEPLPAMYARRKEIQLLVLNLLTNAIKAINEMPKNRRQIQLSVRRAEGCILVEVSDLGKGVPVELQDTLFDAFVTGSEDGFGMGLALCRRITESHGGRIWADFSNATGTAVSFTLPVEKSAR